MINASQHPYGAALLELTDDAGVTERVADEAQQVATLFRDHAEFGKLLSSPSLSTNQRADVLRRAFDGRVHDLLLKLMLVMNKKGRARQIGHMAESFGKLLDQRNGVVEVDAWTAEPMDDGTAARVREGIGVALGGKTVHLNAHTDASLIGGLKLRIGDRVVDGSVAAHLAKMRSRLTQAAR